MGARSTIATLIVLAHLAIIFALSVLTVRPRIPPLATAPVMTLIEIPRWFEPEADLEKDEESSSALAQGATSPPATDASDDPGAAPRRRVPSRAITHPDWQRSAKEAAAKVIADEEARKQRVAQIGRGKIDARTLAKPTPEKGPHFSWSKRTTDDPLVFRLNERCVLLMLMIPVCQVGEIKDDGQLFRDMNAKPVMGDWSDDARSSEETMSERADNEPILLEPVENPQPFRITPPE